MLLYTDRFQSFQGKTTTIFKLKETQFIISHRTKGFELFSSIHMKRVNNTLKSAKPAWLLR